MFRVVPTRAVITSDFNFIIIVAKIIHNNNIIAIIIENLKKKRYKLNSFFILFIVCFVFWSNKSNSHRFSNFKKISTWSCYFYFKGDQGLPGEQGAPGERGIGEPGPKVRHCTESNKSI